MRPDDSELADLINRFVPVRITDFRGVDMKRFRFDYDLTFAVLMMNAEGATLSRFGTRDAESSTNRMSVAGLKRAMREVLARHAKRPPEPPGADAPARGRAAKPLTLDDIPAYAESRHAKAGKCAHCHYAHQYSFQQLKDDGMFSEAMLYRYPLPEAVGVTLDVKENNRVKEVTADSPAAQAGVKTGDVIETAGETPVLTSADLQFALDGVSDPGKIVLALTRGGAPAPAATLSLPVGWRVTDVRWRPSARAMLKGK